MKTIFTKYRVGILFALIFIVPLGLYSKLYHGYAHTWVNNRLGGVFYEIFWCLCLAFFYSKWKPWKIGLIILSITVALEFLQLWHPPFLELLRGNFIGVTVLGNSFSWYDIPYYFIGSYLGIVLLQFIRNKSSKV
mgnify:FL=1